MSRHEVAQLVGAPELDPAAVHLVEVVEVIGLEHLVGELSQAHAVRALQPGLDAVAAQHGAHPEVSAGLGQKGNNAPVLVPAQVVQHGHCARFPGGIVEVHFVVGEYPLDAVPDAPGVLLHGVRGQRLPLAGLPARVPDLSRGPPEHREDVVPGAAEVQQADDGEQVAHMEAVGRGVKAAVHSLSTGLQQPRQLVLGCVFREGVLQNTASVEGEEQPAECRGGAVKSGPEAEPHTRSPEQDTGRMPR